MGLQLLCMELALVLEQLGLVLGSVMVMVLGLGSLLVLGLGSVVGTRLGTVMGLGTRLGTRMGWSGLGTVVGVSSRFYYRSPSCRHPQRIYRRRQQLLAPLRLRCA